MVPSRMLANVSGVEFERRGPGVLGDAGLAFGRGDSERVYAFGVRERNGVIGRRRVRISDNGIDGDRSKTTVHELGHHLEDAHPQMLRSARALIRQRGPDGFVRSGPDHELGLTGVESYASTTYSDATELVSVGLERLYTHPEAFARRDPEYFNWIWRWVIRGETD